MLTYAKCVCMRVYVLYICVLNLQTLFLCARDMVLFVFPPRAHLLWESARSSDMPSLRMGAAKAKLNR